MVQFQKLPDELEVIGKHIVQAALNVHKQLGPGLLESVYEECMVIELGDAGISVQRQLALPIEYRGVQIKSALRIDLLVADRVIVELKAVNGMIPVYEAQLLTYMKLTNNRLGFLINFNVSLIKDGIKRMVL